jgi:hypothetical protein
MKDLDVAINDHLASGGDYGEMWESLIYAHPEYSERNTADAEDVYGVECLADTRGNVYDYNARTGTYVYVGHVSTLQRVPR